MKKSIAESWNAAHYLRFGSERTRAAADLAARINLESPGTIVDLGCGSGNNTELLYRLWPEAQVTGIDNSPQMIAAAREAYPEREWLNHDISGWNPDAPVDLIYSNATLQWLPDHGRLLPGLFSHVAPGGALAFQIPSCIYPLVRHLIFELSREAQWDERMAAPRTRLTMEPVSFYYDVLVAEAAAIDLWETEYIHVLDSRAAVVDWISSTGLRPFLHALDSDSERDTFLAKLQQRVDEEYEVRTDGKVLFPFRRTFVIAYK